MTEVPSHAIHKAACRSGVPPLLAATLAECLYWYQKAKHSLKGERAVWKTGKELQEVLGIASRTGNEHLKKLSRLGYWTIHRYPRPGFNSPSPVNWLIPTDKAKALINDARNIVESQAVTSKRKRKGLSSGDENDLQMSVPLTVLSASPASSPATAFTFPGTEGSKSNSSSKTPKKAGEDASKEVRALIQHCQKRFVTHSQPTWDLTSKFTWSHLQTIYAMMISKGIAPEKVIPHMDVLLTYWDGFIGHLPKKYQSSPHNVGRPSPFALGEEADLLVDIVLAWEAKEEAAAAKKALKLTGSNSSFL